MRDLVASLFELQELEIIRQESQIVHRADSPDRLTKVESRIAALRQSIPARALQRYDRLRPSGPGVVRETGGICANCNLRVPMGDLGRMRRDEMDWRCPNCGRFLLLAEDQ